ncbi:MAG: DNA cytosine methyltransferase, partial [Betaproteobacteria bacterium]|nr:DNA cytosine methyltransferase [Betaproteobacteria bacterium]
MSRRSAKFIPVVDLFAGPGGLGEGFSAYTDCRGRQPFKIAISVEKEELAHRTLLLRSFYRQFPRGEVPTEYYEHVRGNSSFDSFVADIQKSSQGRHAVAEARRHELGADPALDKQLSREIADKIGGDDCVLIGGPPCQAYSLVGRSRNKGRRGYRLEDDPRARLYLEYLQLIADLWPAVFVMENVKGLLSSQMDGERVFDQIYADLSDPADASRGARSPRGKKHRYKIRSLTVDGESRQLTPSDFVIRCE